MIERENELRDRAAASWLITFSDLVALMLAFFVMMYATQKVDTGSWQAMIQSLSQSLRTAPIKATQAIAEHNIEQRNDAQALDLSYLQTLIEGLRENDAAFAGLVLARMDDRLTISLPGDLLFQAGRADPVPRARPRIRRLAELFRNLTNRIDVFGHSDPEPVSGRVFESNRELSLARAEAVAAMIRQAGYPRRIGAFGMGAGQFADLAAIPSLAERIRLSRRVDIVVRPEPESRR